MSDERVSKHLMGCINLQKFTFLEHQIPNQVVLCRKKTVFNMKAFTIYLLQTISTETATSDNHGFILRTKICTLSFVMTPRLCGSCQVVNHLLSCAKTFNTVVIIVCRKQKKKEIMLGKEKVHNCHVKFCWAQLCSPALSFSKAF